MNTVPNVQTRIQDNVTVSASINGHQSVFFNDNGFLVVYVTYGFVLWESQANMPPLNTVCVFEINQETMDSENSILCCYGYPDQNSHFVSGYRLNSTENLNGIYTNNERTVDEFHQMLHVFNIGKYILFTTILRLGSTENEIVIFQHLSNINGTSINMYMII